MSHTTDQPAVGYKNPPLHSRFQKGRSGNPSGRRKAKPQLNLLDEVAKLMAEPIPLVKKASRRRSRSSKLSCAKQQSRRSRAMLQRAGTSSS